MLRRLILAISIALLVVAGLSLLLFAGNSFTFTELLDKLFNNELFGKDRAYSVNVNVYELQLGGAPELRFERAFSGKEDLGEALRLYFTEHGNALGSLTPLSDDDDNQKALSALYENYCVSKSTDMLILERQITTRMHAAVDLRYDVCDIGLQLLSVSYGADDFVELRVRECFAAVFRGIPDKLSTYAGVEHFFVYDKREGSWLIKRHESYSALSVYINGELEKLAEADGVSIKSVTSAVVNDYVAQLKTVLDRETYFYSADGDAPPPVAASDGGDSDDDSDGDSDEDDEDEDDYDDEDYDDEDGENGEDGDSDFTKFLYDYDRDSAAEYAFKYTQRERVRRNVDYPKYERNGTNFTSQCLIGGGIPTNSQWKPVERLAAGENFANADKFYDYITSRDSHIKAGVCGYSEAEKGDIVQFIDGGGGAVHSALITFVARGASFGNAEYLVTANSEELRNFPLSALGFDIMRIIKIDGYFYEVNLDGDSEED